MQNNPATASSGVSDTNKKKKEKEWKREINLSLDENTKDSIKKLIKKYSFILLIIIPLIIAIILRVHLFNLPVADLQAKDAYDYNLKKIIAEEVYLQYSLLPENNKLKLITINLIPGNYELKFSFKNTNVRNIANYISIAAFVLCFIYLLKIANVIRFIKKLNKRASPK